MVRMLTMSATMLKEDFMVMAVELQQGHARVGYKNQKLGLSLADFWGYDEWFGYGEHNDGKRHVICCKVRSDNANGIKFLRKHGFK